MRMMERCGVAFKTISVIVTGIFLFNQIAWAGDLINAALEQQYKDQSQTFAPTYLQNQQAAAENLVAQKQDIQDHIETQTITAQESVQVDLKGPIGGPDSTRAAQEVTASVITANTPDMGAGTAVISITTADGDRISYKDGKILSIERKDGAVITDIEAGDDNNIKSALVTYRDGTSSASYSYITDGSGNIAEIVFKDSDKAVYYDNDGRISRVEFTAGRCIDYENGAISRITEADHGQYIFELKEGADSGPVSTLSQYCAANGTVYRYVINNDSSISVSVEKDGVRAAYNKDGGLSEIIKDGSIITAETVKNAQIGYDAAAALYGKKQQETRQCQAALDDASRGLSDKTAARDTALAALNTATQNLNNAVSVRNGKQAAYNAAYSAYLVVKAAYDALVKQRAKSVLISSAKAALTAKTAAKDKAYAELQKTIKDLSAAQAAKSANQISYNAANAAYLSSKAACNKAIGALEAAKNNEAAAKTNTDSLLAALTALNYAISLFKQQDDALAAACNNMDIVKVSYDAERRVKQVRKMDGSTQDYDNGLPSGILADADTITVDRDGIKSIYDKYGDLARITAGGVSTLLDDGNIVRVEKEDGTVIENASFDSGNNIISATVTRPDGVKAIYKDGVVRESDQPDGTKVYYDAAGNPTGSVGQDGSVYHYTRSEAEDGVHLVATADKSGAAIDYVYDDNNNVVKATVLPTEDDPVPMVSEYEYGRIRRVYKGDELIYRYTYEFDGSGEEVTVIEDISAGCFNRYRDQTLISVTSKDGLLTKYQYGGDNRISKSTVSYLGKVMNEYKYSYDGDNAVITDMDGVNRTYDKDNKLVYLEEGGATYAYTYITARDGTEETSQELVAMEYEDGSVASYKDGVLTSITRADGAILGDFLASGDGVSSYSVSKDGIKYIVKDGYVERQTKQDGTEIEYYRCGLAKSVKAPDGGMKQYDYEMRADGSLDMAAQKTKVVASGIGTDKALQLAPCLDPKIPLYLHFEGGNNSTATADDSYFNNTVAFHGDARIDTANKKLGSSSLYLDGVGDYLTIPGGNICDFGNGDFTVSFWTKLGSTGAAPLLAWDNNSDYIEVVNYGMGPMILACIEGNPMWIMGGLSAGNWNHIALVRSGNTLKIYLNGSMQYSVTLGNNLDNIGDLYIGHGPGAACSGYMKGWIDELRIDKGRALWASNFNPSQGLPKESFCEASGYIMSDPIEISSTPDSISWNELLPANTDITVQTRTGNSADPEGGTWSAWSGNLTDPSGSVITSPAGKFIQYKVNLTNNDWKSTPKLTGAPSIRYAADGPNTGVVEYVTVSENGVSKRYASGTVCVEPAADNERLAAFSGEISSRTLPDDTVVEAKSFRDGAGSNNTLQISKDGRITYLLDGKITSVYQKYGDGHVEPVAEYSYDSAGELSNIRLTSSRASLDSEMAKARQEIADAKSDYLRTLAQQKGLAYTQIRDQAQVARNQINSERSRLQSQLYQEVTKSKWVGWWIFGWWETYTETVEVPGVRDAINQLNEQERQLDDQEAKAYAQLSGEVATAESMLTQDESAALAGIAGQESSFQSQIIKEEATPVILDCYRSILGRDPDETETNSRLATVDYGIGLDAAALRVTLLDSAERREQEIFVDGVKAKVKGALYGYLELDEALKGLFLGTLGLTAADCVSLGRKDADAVLSLLDKQNIHFGKSAFVALEALLKEKNIAYALDELAVKAILVDVLTGALNCMSDGRLLELSMYSLSKVASTYGLILYNTKIDFDDLTKLNAGTAPNMIGTGTVPNTAEGRVGGDCPLNVIAHLKNDHFVIVTDIASDGKVSYTEHNRGKSGFSWTVSKEDFLKGWTGYTIIKGLSPTGLGNAQEGTAPLWLTSKVVSTETAQRVKGSCLPFLFPLLGAIIGAIAGATAAVVGAITAVVTAVSAVIAPVITGIGALVAGVGEVMAGIGAAVFSAVQFVGASLIGALSPVGAWLEGFSLTKIGSLIAHTVVTTALSIGVSKGLDALGVNPVVSGMLTSFVTGGVSGLFNNGLSAFSFITGGLRGAAVQGLGALGAHLGADPMLGSVISIAAGSIIGSIGKNISPETGRFDLEGFSASIGKEVLPDIRSEFVRSGVARTAQFLGMDPRLSCAASSFSSTLIDGVINDADVADSVSRAVNSAIVSVGVKLLEGVDPAFSVLRSAELMGAMEDMLGSAGLFDSIFGVIDAAASSATGNFITFADLVRENGPLDSVNSALNSLFTRETVEGVVAQGGIESILTRPMSNVMLEDGSVGKELVIDSDSSLTFTESGDLVSVKDDGIICSGSFVYTDSRGVRLENGVVQGKLETGYSIWADIDDGSAKEIKINDIKGKEVLDIKPDIPGNAIIIARSPSEFNFVIADAILCLAGAYIFSVNNSNVSSIEQKISAVSAGALFNGTDKYLYALANGIANPPADQNAPPAYILNLMDDLAINSSGDISKEKDMLPVPLYQGMTSASSINGIMDALGWLAESQTVYQGFNVQKAWAAFRGYFNAHPSEISRPIVGMGYSGGFMPLIKAMSFSICNVKTIVGLGAPTAYINSDILAIVISALKFIAGNCIDSARGALKSCGLGEDAFMEGFIKAAQGATDAIFPYLKEALLRLGAMKSYGATTFCYSPPSADLVVNLWGSEDIFYKIGAVDKRDNFLGKMTYNIEILGAEHTDYIRRDVSDKADPPDEWNNAVASFVTDLMIASKNKYDLDDFIKNNKYISKENTVYVVRLPGCGVC